MKGIKPINKIAGIIITIGLATGIVYAGFNYENIKKYVIGGGIEKAAENGYVENVEMDYINQETSLMQENEIVVDNVNVDFKIDDFTMDDTNLCMNFSFKFSDNIKEYIELDDIHKFLLKDFTIIDEESRILFDNSYGLNTVKTKIDKSKNIIGVLYNMFGYDKYPKSKKLYLNFTQIILTEYNEELDFQNEKFITLNGNWQMELDVPEKMYNRASESYKVISCSNDNFKVHTAVVTETGFEFGAIIENCENYYDDISITDIIDKMSNIYKSVKEISDENIAEKEKLIKEYYNLDNKLRVIITDRIDFDNSNKRVNPTYILNSDGNRFELDETPGKTQKYEFIGDETYDFIITFQMTKDEATDLVNVVLDYRGEIVTIQLEKVK